MMNKSFKSKLILAFFGLAFFAFFQSCGDEDRVQPAEVSLGDMDVVSSEILKDADAPLYADLMQQYGFKNGRSSDPYWSQVDLRFEHAVISEMSDGNRIVQVPVFQKEYDQDRLQTQILTLIEEEGFDKSFLLTVDLENSAQTIENKEDFQSNLFSGTIMLHSFQNAEMTDLLGFKLQKGKTVAYLEKVEGFSSSDLAGGRMARSGGWSETWQQIKDCWNTPGVQDRIVNTGIFGAACAASVNISIAAAPETAGASMVLAVIACGNAVKSSLLMGAYMRQVGCFVN
ncbi:hypothetical protein QQ008_11465 [Fulvivirgaceae bacterium BMA10]|uniref:Lipoprotein n=1 Tax=Splendidivirga corallicola TaxID=3051826 RepID=A0ABT8KP37_9BACT|nr:hypothetical protein [Fulvivirgaceae bacterium BMA10]